MNTYKIDAKGKKIGRLSTEVASLLMGKNNVSMRRNVVMQVKVEILNSDKMIITEKKKTLKSYKSYSGYPGGLKSVSLQQMIAKKGLKEALRKSVYGMLPKNKLRSRMIKNLHLS